VSKWCKIFFCLATVLLSDIENGFAQLFTNNGATVNIRPGATMIVRTGSVNNTAGGTFTNAGTLTVEGNLENNATLQGVITASLFRVQENWVNNAVFNAVSSTVEMYGANQLITGAVITDFYILSLTGTGIKTQTIDARVSQRLELNDRELATDVHKMFIITPTAVNTITRTTGFVSSLGPGRLARLMNSWLDDYLFPVGSSVGTTRYRPVIIRPLGVSMQNVGVRMANVDATTEGFDRNVKQPDICIVNPLYYHLVEKISGTDALRLNFFYDPVADGTFSSVGRWQNIPEWQNIGPATPGVAPPFNSLTIPTWNQFNPQAFALISEWTTASINYPGSPYCTNQVGTVSPVITGTTGGTFTSSPAGLAINAAGVITPSASAQGVYTVTYTLPPANGCPAFTTTQTVVINSLPPNPTLSPTNPCAGTPVTLTASGGSWYEFFVNGISQGPPGASNTISFTSLNAGDLVCVNSYPPPPFNFNGMITEQEWGSPISTSFGGPAASGFGVNNMDALYFKNGGGYLYGAIAGRVENGSNNRILLFIDCQPGGFNNLAAWTNRSNAPYYSVENLSSGIVFDPGFEPEYVLAMNEATGEAFFDLYNMVANVNNYIGSNLSSNLLGYLPNTGTGDYTRGFEFSIPLNLLGNPVNNLKAFAMLVNDPGIGLPTFISNQFLTPCGPAELNYGNGAINFGLAAPNPVVYPMSADCFSQNCVTAINPVTPTFSAIPPICVGQAAPLLPATSSNGINGTWSPLPVSNTTSGTYNFTPTTGQCATPTTVNITVEQLPILSPIYHD
jgi:hypothetical protein